LHKIERKKAFGNLKQPKNEMQKRCNNVSKPLKILINKNSVTIAN